jgi:hypothetical protein
MAQCSMLIPPDTQFFDANGDPLASGTVEFYVAGGGAGKAVYADGNGLTSLGTTVGLDSSGRAKIWLDGYYYVVLKDSLGNTIWTEDNVSSAYSPAASTAPTMSEWQLEDDIYTFVGATQFSVPGDQTLTYTIGRRIKATVTAGTIYGTITNSVAAGGVIVTTVTVLWDLAFALDAGLSAVWTGIVSPIYSGAPYQLPISSVIDWYPSIAGTPALCYGWVQCDGQTLNDALSPLNGQVIPNLNGAAAGADTFANGKIAVYTRGGTVSGTYSADAIIAHAHGTSAITANDHTHGPGTLSTDDPGTHVHNVTIQKSIATVQSGAGTSDLWQNGSASPQSQNSDGGGAHSHAVNAGLTAGTGAPINLTGNTDVNGAATETIPKTVTVVKIIRVK